MHKIAKGGAGHSFGIAVAKLAGIPLEVCESASRILEDLRGRTRTDVAAVTGVENLVARVDELIPVEGTDYGKVLEILGEIDVSQTTPLEALNILARLKSLK